MFCGGERTSAAHIDAESWCYTLSCFRCPRVIQSNLHRCHNGQGIFSDSESALIGVWRANMCVCLRVLETDCEINDKSMIFASF